MKKYPFVMNLQLFAEDGIESPNEGQDGVVDQQTTEGKTTSTDTSVKTEEVAKTPQQSKEENATIAQYRRDAERAKKADELIAKQYPQPIQINGKTFNIKTVEDYEQALQAQREYEQSVKQQEDAQKLADDPKELAKKVQDLENKLTAREKADLDKESAEYGKKIDADLKSIMDMAKKDNVKLTEDELLKTAIDEGMVNLNDVYKLRFKPELDTKALKAQAVKEYIEGLRQGKSPVEGSGSSPVVVTTQPKGTRSDPFKGARESALAFLRANRETK